ncbi:hypothetical protein FUAX_47600 (plasmid) [Fulvitalea axinellae]|uniref:Uncharacterized protein n=1 Tax=Fulvitalea axinellae TaxID=1182444 RepID=A0AAU9CQ22_9BACT|nr:hypothetical protein FUAX_47600 [Fulvitalea axinellae]
MFKQTIRHRHQNRATPKPQAIQALWSKKELLSRIPQDTDGDASQNDDHLRVIGALLDLYSSLRGESQETNQERLRTLHLAENRTYRYLTANAFEFQRVREDQATMMSFAQQIEDERERLIAEMIKKKQSAPTLSEQEAQFDTRGLWQHLLQGRGPFKVNPKQSAGLFAKELPGFRTGVMARVSKLLLTKTGTALLREISNGSHSVTISPHQERIPSIHFERDAIRPKSEPKGKNCSSQIYWPCNISENAFGVFDEYWSPQATHTLPGAQTTQNDWSELGEAVSEDRSKARTGHVLPEPSFVLLGRMLKHASKAQRGMVSSLQNRSRYSDPAHSPWLDAEEESVAKDFENPLREEVSLGTRKWARLLDARQTWNSKNYSPPSASATYDVESDPLKRAEDDIILTREEKELLFKERVTVTTRASQPQSSLAGRIRGLRNLGQPATDETFYMVPANLDAPVQDLYDLKTSDTYKGFREERARYREDEHTARQETFGPNSTIPEESFFPDQPLRHADETVPILFPGEDFSLSDEFVFSPNFLFSQSGPI